MDGFRSVLRFTGCISKKAGHLASPSLAVID